LFVFWRTACRDADLTNSEVLSGAPAISLLLHFLRNIQEILILTVGILCTGALAKEMKSRAAVHKILVTIRPSAQMHGDTNARNAF